MSFDPCTHVQLTQPGFTFSKARVVELFAQSVMQVITCMHAHGGQDSLMYGVFNVHISIVQVINKWQCLKKTWYPNIPDWIKSKNDWITCIQEP